MQMRNNEFVHIVEGLNVNIDTFSLALRVCTPGRVMLAGGGGGI